MISFCCSDVSKCKQWRVGLLPAIASSNTSSVYPGLENWWSFFFAFSVSEPNRAGHVLPHWMPTGTFTTPLWGSYRPNGSKQESKDIQMDGCRQVHFLMASRACMVDNILLKFLWYKWQVRWSWYIPSLMRSWYAIPIGGFLSFWLTNSLNKTTGVSGVIEYPPSVIHIAQETDTICMLSALLLVQFW